MTMVTAIAMIVMMMMVVTLNALLLTMMTMVTTTYVRVAPCHFLQIAPYDDTNHAATGDDEDGDDHDDD